MTSMENKKQSKLKSKILKILPKAISAFTFQNPPFSPGTGRSHLATGRGFSGPIISIIPDEARRKKKGESLNDDQEPTSPKVSCMGKIKNKKKIMNTKQQLVVSPSGRIPAEDKRNKTSNVLKIFNIRAESKKKKMEGCSANDNHGHKKDEVVPGLGQLKRFTSGRVDHGVANIDWTAQITLADTYHRSCYSDEDQGRVESDDHDIEDDEEHYRITFSAPIVRGGGDLVAKPKKEVNLWKRRTMDPPRPLQLNPMFCQD